jgi:hypothetical protein
MIGLLAGILALRRGLFLLTCAGTRSSSSGAAREPWAPPAIGRAIPSWRPTRSSCTADRPPECGRREEIDPDALFRAHFEGGNPDADVARAAGSGHHDGRGSDADLEHGRLRRNRPLQARATGVAAVHCLPGGSADADAAADPGARLSSTVISGAIAVIIRRTSRALLPAAKHTTSHRRHGEHDRK